MNRGRADAAFLNPRFVHRHIMVLRKLKRLLGMGSDESDTGRSDRDVVVQEEGSGEPVAAGTDADASTESLVDEEEARSHPESRAEPAEAAGPGAEDETTDIEEADAETDAADVEDTVADATTEEADIDGEPEEGTDVDEIKGIGPAYSDRLNEVGIHSVAQLADANPAELAERTTVSEKTVRKWVDRAQAIAE